MFLSPEHVIAISRTEPASRVDLRQRQLVGQMDSLKCAVPQKLMITNPAAVCIQSNPGTGQRCKCPARFSNFARRLQIETVKGQFSCPEQSPRFQSEKRRDRGATERHQKWDQRVNAANSQETSKKYEYANDFLRPCQRIISLN